MKLIKYVSLVSKLSSIEGRKESIKGQQNHSAKLLQRGVINEDAFVQQSDEFVKELRCLDHEKRSALRHYAAA